MVISSSVKRRVVITRSRFSLPLLRRLALLPGHLCTSFASSSSQRLHIDCGLGLVLPSHSVISLS